MVSADDRAPGRPRFHWDPRNAPWTDGRDPQDEYIRAVKHWCRYHDAVPDSYSKKVPTDLQAMLLHAQLQERANEITMSIDVEQLKSPTGEQLLFEAIDKLYRIQVISDTSNSIKQLTKCKGTN